MTALNTMVLYHATSKRAADAILSEDLMRPGAGGKAGPAIYFVEDPQSAFCKSQQGAEVVLEVTVNMGRMKTIRQANKTITGVKLASEGYDSVMIDLRYPVYAVYRSDQILSISKCAHVPVFYNSYYDFDD